jgi:hypothetical protein
MVFWEGCSVAIFSQDDGKMRYFYSGWSNQRLLFRVVEIMCYFYLGL